MKDGTAIQMFPHRVAIKPLLLLFLWAVTFLGLSTAQHVFEYSAELAEVIPECGSHCFVAFLNSHFTRASCDESTLKCLCTQRGAGGFTVGEGAVQCLEAESRVGLCRGGLVSRGAIEKAYFMCSEQAGAVRATHTALEGTFVVTGTAGGVVLAPPPTETPTRTMVSTTRLPTTLIVETSSLTLSTSAAVRETTTRREAETSALSSLFTPTPEPSGNEAAAESSGSTEERFGTKQVIGLSVGIAGALGLLLAAFLLARCRRRKRLDNASPPLVEAPHEKRMTRGFWGGQDRREIVHISPPLPGMSPVLPPAGRSRRTVWPDTIGMALSRPQSGTQSAISSPHYRRASKLLPPKPYASRPYLTLNIPDVKLSVSPPNVSEPAPPARAAPPQIQVQTQGKAPLFSQLAKRPPGVIDGRESAMTEFEEDGIMSASVASRTASQVWRPPPSDPRSATTYYVADRSGNWVLGRPDQQTQKPVVAELEASALPAKKVSLPVNTALTSQAGMGHGKGSPIAPTAPQGPTKPAAVNLLPAASILTANGKPMSRSSSIYSQEKERAAQNAKMGPAASTHNVPAMSFSHPEPPRRRSNSLTNRKPNGRTNSQDGLGRQDSHVSHGSNNSVSTIGSYGGEGEEEVRILDQGNLSPVVESPEAIVEQTRPPPGQGLGLSNNGRLMFRPPPVRLGLHSPPGQPSPTLGMVQGASNQPRAPYQMTSDNMPHRYAAGAVRPPARNGQPGSYGTVPRRPDPAQFSTGSPALSTMRIVPPSHSASVASAYPSPLRPQRASMQRTGGPYGQPQPARTYPAPDQQRPHPTTYGQYAPYRPQAAGIHQALWGQGPVPGQDARLRQQEAGWRPQPAQQVRPDGELSQLQQQLRRPDLQQGGPYPQHIAQQQARPSMPASAHSQSSQSWSSSSSSLAAKRLGNERAAALAVQTTGSLRNDPRWRPSQGTQQSSGGLSSDGQTWALPQTPGWQPKLTPTRRGDDLFLNVQ